MRILNVMLKIKKKIIIDVQLESSRSLQLKLAAMVRSAVLNHKSPGQDDLTQVDT